MSNYLIALCRDETWPRLESWLALAGEDEVHVDRLGHGHRVAIVARGVSRRLSGRGFFTGTAIDTEALELGFGRAGWARMAARADTGRRLAGEFLSAEWDDERLVLRRDFSGAAVLHETRGEGWIAFSDALLLLADLRRSLGERLSLNSEVVVARSRTLAVAVQPISSETQLREIRFVPAGESRSVHLDEGRRLRVRREREDPTEEIARVRDDPVSAVRTLAGHAVGLVAAVATRDDLVPTLALSGGVDSRLVLAAAAHAGVADRLLIESWNRTEANRADFAVAARLAERLGLGLNDVARHELGAPIPYADAVLPIWASGRLGSYDRIVPAGGRHVRPRRLAISGVGAENLKGNYGWRSLADWDARLHGAHRDGSRFAAVRRRALLAQLGKALHELDVDPAAGDASERQYAAFRSGIHGTAHASYHLSGLRPLHLPLGLDIARALFTGHEQEWPRFVVEEAVFHLLALVSPELAAEPFADSSRDRAFSHVAEIVSRYRKPLLRGEVPGYSVMGDFAETWTGPSVLDLAVARRWGLDGPDDAHGLLGRMREWRASIPHRIVRGILVEQEPLVVRDIVRDGRALRDAGPALAKGLTAALLAEAGPDEGETAVSAR